MKYKRFKNMIQIHPKIKVLIFDCDGTIVDNMHIHYNSWKVIEKRYKINVTPEVLSHYNGIPTINVLNKIKKLEFNQELKKIVKEKENIVNEKIHESLPIKPIIQVIKKYHNKLPMVVISGGTAKNVHKTLNIFKIKHLFDWIITADDDHPTKDSPLAFKYIAKKFNINPNLCQVFEDGKSGLINALKANMVVTDVRTFYP